MKWNIVIGIKIYPDPPKLNYYVIIHIICYSVPESTLMHERQKVENLKFNHYLKLDKYVMDVKGYYPYLHELTNDILKFKPEHLQAANKILNELNPNHIEIKNV